MLSEDNLHSALERNSHGAHGIMKEPLEVLLEDSIEAATMHTQNSIQARLRGVSAMTSVEKTQPIVTDFGNFAAM